MLRDLQAAMRRELLRAGAGLPPGVLGDAIPASVRFAIHANNVVGSLVAALEAAFPMTARLLGQRAFRTAAQRFVRRHPPRVPQLLDYGDRFPDHLDRTAGVDRAAGDSAAGDLARFEWAWNAAYFAADAPVLDVAAARALPAERYPTLRLRLHPSAHLLTCAHPALDVWDALRRGENVPVAARCQRILIVRPLLDVQSAVLGPGELTLLMALSAGADLAHAAMAASETEPGLDLTATLLAHLQLGTFTTFDDPPGRGPGMRPAVD